MKKIILGAFLVLLFAVFAALGTWQVLRLSWKLDLIARVDQRVHATAVAAPAVVSGGDEYRKVTASGTFLNDKETLVQAVTELGAGFWVMTPLKQASGQVILVNRGFVPPDKREPAQHSQPDGVVSITGLVRLTEPKGGFLRTNDPGAGRWYSRDVTEIGAAAGLQAVVPYFVDADATVNPGGYPVGGLTVIRFSNNHLIYALTWFGLAIMSVVGGLILFRKRDRVVVSE
jgi:surfeit locus 1 family protein